MRRQNKAKTHTELFLNKEPTLNCSSIQLWNRLSNHFIQYYSTINGLFREDWENQKAKNSG